MDSPAHLRLRGPSLAAQAWTTVWTPDSAPALRTAGTDADDHDSKTNCYPCKVWDKGANSGKGGWTPLPATTEPIICAGDTNDYTCKECDGTGGVRNKADGTDCSTDSIMEGCCHGGVCIQGRPLTDWADLQACPKLLTRPNYTPGHTEPACSHPIRKDPDNPGGFNFRDCCIGHDQDYRTCNKTKAGADTRFDTCLDRVCDDVVGWANQARCRAIAWEYKKGVRTPPAKDAYRNGQVEGCYCCEPEKM